MKKYLFIFMFINIFFITNVYADVFSSSISSSLTCDKGENSSPSYCLDTTNISVPSGVGKYVVGSFLAYPVNSSQYDWIRGVAIRRNSDGVTFECGIGTQTMQANGNQMQIVTFNCPVKDSTESENYRLEYFKGTAGVSTGIKTTGRVSITTGTDNTINAQITSLTTLLQNLYNRVDGGFSDLYTLMNLKQSEMNNHLGDIYNLVLISNNHLTDIYNALINNSSSIVNEIQTQTQQQQQQNQIINNTDTGTNASDFSNVVNNNTLPNNSHAFDILSGLQGLINGLQPSGSCSRISIPIPFTNQTLILPCMTTDVYSVHFPEIVVIWQLIVRGIAYYYILVNILRLVKETIDPFNFKLEVMDL